MFKYTFDQIRRHPCIKRSITATGKNINKKSFHKPTVTPAQAGVQKSRPKNYKSPSTGKSISSAICLSLALGGGVRPRCL